MWDTLKIKMLGGTLGGFGCIVQISTNRRRLHICFQMYLVFEIPQVQVCWNLYNFRQKFGEWWSREQNTCIGMFSSWLASSPSSPPVWLAAGLSWSLSLSGSGTERREKSIVTRLVTRFRGGARPSGSEGRGGMLTECLLVNLPFWRSWEVTG